MPVDEDILFRLNVDAQKLGIQYLGTDPQELAKIIAMAQASRRGKPPCFLRSFSAVDQLCRQCDEYQLCGDKTIVPHFVLEARPLLECDMCDGDLIIDLFDDHGHVVDQACSTPGCRNTHYQQQQRAK